MKIAWFTPFRKASSIGRFSQLVTQQLSASAQVDLWVADGEGEELHDTSLRVIHYPQIANPERFLIDYDCVAYNLGDQAANHGAIFAMSQRHPGIIILHDYVMHHFFASYYYERGEFDKFVEILRRRYGATVTKTADGWDGEILRLRDTNAVIAYPLFEEAIQRCEGIVTHATFVQEAVARVAGAPVCAIPLASTANRQGPTLSRAELGIPEDRALVLTVGHINENKRGDIVLQTLAGDPELAPSVVYVLAGGNDGPFGQELLALHKKLGLEDVVRFTGYADDTLLRSLLTHADVCVNLRWPAMEGGSGSCAEQMLFGKATIVTDTGVYSEIPDACVWKVRPPHEAEDLKQGLRELVKNRELRRSIEESARSYAEANFAPEVYALRFLDFWRKLARFKPAMTLIDTAAAELRKLGVTPDMAIAETVAHQTALLSDGDYDPPILRDRA